MFTIKLNEDDEEMAQGQTPQERNPIKVVGNKVYYHLPVNKKNIEYLITTLQEISNELLAFSTIHETEPPPIYLYIHSEGGDAHAGLSAMDHIKNMAVPVYTVVDGYCASAGTFILMGGEKKFALPTSTVLIHQFRTGFWGTYEDLKDEMQNSDKLMKRLQAVYKHNTDLTTKMLNNLLKRELELNSDECVKYKVVDEILQRNNKRKRLY